jgi:alcohol dehydrogenase (cytochrome c)
MTTGRLKVLVVGSLLTAGCPVFAADVTPERLVNADREPQNWLMNHRTYDAQRYSLLDKINKSNVKSLKLAYAVALGGTSAGENLESTPLAEDGSLRRGSVGRSVQNRRPIRR